MDKHTDTDVARRVPYAGDDMTTREKTNVIGVNMVWHVADDLDHAQAQFEEYAAMAECGDQVAARWVAYWLERLPQICAENRDKLMEACHLLAEANGVRFKPCHKGEPALRGKDGYMCLQEANARGLVADDEPAISRDPFAVAVEVRS